MDTEKRKLIEEVLREIKHIILLDKMKFERSGMNTKGHIRSLFLIEEYRHDKLDIKE